MFMYEVCCRVLHRLCTRLPSNARGKRFCIKRNSFSTIINPINDHGLLIRLQVLQNRSLQHKAIAYNMRIASSSTLLSLSSSMQSRTQVILIALTPAILRRNTNFAALKDTTDSNTELENAKCDNNPGCSNLTLHGHFRHKRSSAFERHR
jgi:hypothetical protein